MVVMRVIEEVRIVVLILLSQINLMQQATLHEQSESPINGRPRSRGILLASTLPEFVSRKVLFRRESRVNNTFSLRRLAKPFLFKKDLKTILDVLKLHD